MVIDFHTHSFADHIADNAVETLEKQADIKAVDSGTPDALRNHMRQYSVDISVVLPVATKPSQVATINDWAKAQRDDQLEFFGAVHPDDPDFGATVKSLKADGFRGVKFHPDYQHFFADEKRLMPLYELLRDAGLMVMLHSGVDIGFPSPVYCTPLMVRHIIDHVPGIKLIAAHMGAHALWRDVEDVLIGQPVYIDTSYSHYLLGSEGMERMIKMHGAENVLFGTDYPWKSPREEIENIRSLSLSSGDIDKIMYENARLLLGGR